MAIYIIQIYINCAILLLPSFFKTGIVLIYGYILLVYIVMLLLYFLAKDTWQSKTCIMRERC